MYEPKAFPIGLPDPLAAIQFRMEQQGLKAKDLIPYFGSASKVSEVLSGKRRLSVTMMRNLVEGLGIPAKVFLATPKRTTNADEEDSRELAELLLPTGQGAASAAHQQRVRSTSSTCRRKPARRVVPQESR